MAGRHEAGWRFDVVSADTGAQAAALTLIVIKTDGAVDLLSVDNEHAASAEGDRLLVLAPPDNSLADKVTEPLLAHA